MKRLIISCTILVALTALAVSSYFYITHMSDDIIGKIELVENRFENGDYEGAKFIADNLEKEWESFSKNRHLIADKEHIMEITSSISKIKAYADEENSELPIECKAVQAMLKLYRNKQGLQYYNLI